MPSILDRINQGQTVTPGTNQRESQSADTPKGPASPGRQTVSSEAAGAFLEIKNRVQNRLLSELDQKADMSRVDEVKKKIRNLFDQILVEEKLSLSSFEKSRLFEQIIAEILGFGPLQNLLEDPTITEIMVNGPDEVYIEKEGKLKRIQSTFENNNHVMRIIDKIVAPLGRRIDETSPYVDARMPDGSRVNAIIPPISLVGPVITIRKFAKNPITIDKLLHMGANTSEAVYFLKACVEARLNILISGGTGSGKTTFLNILSSYIPDDERIITIENAAELQLRQEHVVTLESRPVNIEGKGEVTIRDLVINALRMRPDRIVVGEIRDGAALDMLQAMNTGHDGSMTTLHSNSPYDTLSRLETMVLMAGMDLPMRAIREQISSAIDLIIHQERMRDGTRKITSISEVAGMENTDIIIREIFKFKQTGFKDGKVQGQLYATGYKPKSLEKIESAGITLPDQLFGSPIR